MPRFYGSLCTFMFSSNNLRYMRFLYFCACFAVVPNVSNTDNIEKY